MPAERSAERRPWWRALTWLHAVPVLAAVVLGAWAYSSPPGSSPDDDYHLVSIWCGLGERDGLCERADDDTERTVAPAVVAAACFAHNPEASGLCQRPLFQDGLDPEVDTDRGVFDRNYPPVFYAVMSVFASPDVGLTVIAVRWFALLSFLALTVATFVLLPVARRPMLVWTWLLTSVPLGLFLIASTNPSGWAVAGVGTAFLALVGWFETAGRRRIALGAIAAVAGVMAAGARSDAAVYTGLAAVLAVLLTARRTREFAMLCILPAAISVLAFLLFLIPTQSAAVAEGLGSPAGEVSQLSGFALFAYNLLEMPGLWWGVFGGDGWGLGWLDTQLPAVVTLGALVVFVVTVFTGFADTGLRKRIALIGLAAILWLLPAWILIRSGWNVGQGVQPRYLLPLVVLFAAVAAFAVARGGIRLGRLQAAAVIAGLAIAQTFALHVNLRRYVTGIDVQGIDLDAGAEWWWPGLPFSPTMVWVLGSLAFLGLLLVLVPRFARAQVDPVV